MQEDKNGYHLVMNLEGFMMADDSQPTDADAKRSTRELFDIGLDPWSEE